MRRSDYALKVPDREYLRSKTMTNHQIIRSAEDLGRICRLKRKSLGLRLQDAAMVASVNYRFASNFENGKPTAQLALALKYAAALGLTLYAMPDDGPA